MGSIKLKNNNVTFIHIPKTGGKSIRDWMLAIPDAEIMPLNGNDIQIKHPDVWKTEEYFGELGWTFCCVRNPYDRILSMWQHLKKTIKYKGDFTKFVMEDADYNTYMKPMSTWFDEVDYVMKFENLNKDFKLVQEKLKKTDSLKHIGKGTLNKFDTLMIIELYYTDEVKEFVTEKFKEDLERFNYSYPK